MHFVNTTQAYLIQGLPQPIEMHCFTGKLLESGSKNKNFSETCSILKKSKRQDKFGAQVGQSKVPKSVFCCKLEVSDFEVYHQFVRLTTEAVCNISHS